MNPQNKPKNLQDKLKQLQQLGFVGREDQVNQFRQNLALPPEDDRRRFLYNVWGQGGVGKSTLLRQFRKIAEKTAVVLFFDTYERTGEFLDNWLREILEGRHGEVSLNILITIAGRQELDKNHWEPYEGVIVRFPLEPFTEEEAQQYLTRKGITDNRIIEVILRLSGNLPLLVGMLADAHPNDPKQVIEPSSNAVERFFKWIDDPKRRQMALDAAIPRCLNQDVIAKLRGEKEADELFTWLKETSFVNERTDGWAYHDVVKTQMLRHKRLSSPQSWADIHGKLAEYYDSLRNDLQLEEHKKQRDPSWQSHTLNVLYHNLCQSPQKNLSLAINEFLAALKNQRKFLQQYAETML
ncbi:ATP-binding protein [Nostoc sp. XA010]|uniref:ATP-binding protein n=1 Tax=Nostoc sp. XA010 TaxID=2780407 RepID=UPI001E482816|nr:ATP-binding protein [Nostoc sp. XA010]MCC5655513.1 ATP-binding protein [Nostoc sp. XA010]